MSYIGGMDTNLIPGVEEAIVDLKLHGGRQTFDHTLRMHTQSDANAIKNILTSKGLVKLENPKFDSQTCILTPLGWNFTTFQDEKEKNELEIKLRRISYDSARINKWLPLYALVIAIISAVTPYVIYRISNHNVQKTDTRIEQLEKVLSNQEQFLQVEKNFLDSLTKILNEKANATPKKH